MTKLTVLREQAEAGRFGRQEMDDARTAIRRVDAEGLARALAKAIEGEVRFDHGSRALYATDGSNYRQAPIGVVVPKSKEDVAITMALCREYGAPVLSRGGGTSLAGQCCNVAVVMDFTKYMSHVLIIDEGRRLGTVQPGCVLDDLRNTAKKYGLTFGPDPSTHSHCALGGMLGNNSCGSHSLLSKNNGFGLRCSDNTHELEILTYRGAHFRVGPTSPEELQRIIAAGGEQGRIYREMKQLIDEYADEIRAKYPKIPRRVSGYNLDDLLPENGFHVARALVGSEATLVSILEATLHLVPEPKERVLLLLGYPTAYDAANHCCDILEFRPTALEGIDDILVGYEKNRHHHTHGIHTLPEGGGWLFAEFSGDSRDEAEDAAHRCMEALKKKPDAPNMRLVDSKQEEEELWKVREDGLGATAWVPGIPDGWPGWEDSAVAVEKIGPYLHDLKELFEKYQYKVSTYGHFGQGIVHCRIPFDLYTREGIEKYQRFMEEATDLCHHYGGSFSGEHGDGQARAMYLPKMFSPQIVQAFERFKRIWDPDWKMNPGKVVDPYTPTENLRLGTDYNPPQPQTYFSFHDDQYNLSRAALRCVGVGNCRQHGNATMCPSYMVTKEEMHSTRGRAHLLWEMLNGEVIVDGWKNETVKEALDLCLACKGCKGECPVNVDMATLKAEFRAHHYEKRLRPRFMYAFGWVHTWSRLASVVPTLANLISQTPGISAVFKWLGGVSQSRTVPEFAPFTFKQWFRQHQSKNPNAAPVVLYPDTFNNYFHPETAIAAVEVLEDAGFHVVVPEEDVCCGRPLYDYGFLNMAKRRLHDNIHKLRPFLQADIPIVVLEPSCWAVFVDELPNMLPKDRDGSRLTRNVHLLANFLEEKAPGYKIPKLHRKALLHRHCHQKSELHHAKDYEGDVLQRMGLDLQEPETGCCGMAGAFGYEPGDHYDVSIRCGERVLLPEVRQAGEQDLLITDGFSCREQVAQETSRRTLHLAQVIQLAKHHGQQGPEGQPEDELVQLRKQLRREAAMLVGAGLLAGVAAGVLFSALQGRTSDGASRTS